MTFNSMTKMKNLQLPFEGAVEEGVEEGVQYLRFIVDSTVKLPEKKGNEPKQVETILLLNRPINGWLV